MQRRATHHLDVEVALAERAGRLADDRERLGQQLVEVLARLASADGTPVSARSSRVGDASISGSKRGDLGHDRLEELELPALARVEDPFEEAHRGESTGGLLKIDPLGEERSGPPSGHRMRLPDGLDEPKWPSRRR